MNDNDRSVPRRTLVHGAAWSVPIVAMTAAAPAYAASPRCAVPIRSVSATATVANLNSALAAVPASVPTGARRMHFVVVGGQGGGPLGRGARVEGDIQVAPGQSVSLIAGAGGATGSSGRGGKSAYGNGGDGGTGSEGLRGSGGGGASALLLGGGPIVVAGGGGGAFYNRGPSNGTPQAGLYSGTLFQNFTATSGGSSATSNGGSSHAGITATGLSGSTGALGWMGQRPSTSTPPTSNQVVLMTGGGGGGSATAPGGAGGPNWVSGPNFSVSSSVSGFSGSGSNGGNGATDSASNGGSAGGGGGGYRGGGGGGSAAATWNQPPAPYNGPYGIASAGGGGSSYRNGSFTNLTIVSDTRSAPSTGTGNMGFVEVTFYPC